MPNSKSATKCCLIIALILIAGCGGDPLGRHAISGKVTLDGQPVQNGMISFIPAGSGATSSGASFTNGEYSIAQEQGLPVGKYTVTINAPKPGTGALPAEGAMPGEALPVPQELIPADWNVKSAQTIEVKEDGPFEFNFDIVSKK